jgi:peroxiredoxin
MGPPQPGDLAPDFQLSPRAGAPFHLASQRGHWVVLHFTASWCPFCDAEVEHLGELADAYLSRGVTVVLIGIKEEATHWGEYSAAHVARSVVVLDDEDGAVSKKYAPPHAQPSFQDRAQVMLDTSVIVDPEGKIRFVLFPDSAHFDPTFKATREVFDQLLAGGTAAAPQATHSLAPEQIVAIEATAPHRVAPGGEGEIDVVLAIADGYHVMSDHPSDPDYIPTRVRFADADGLTWRDPVYPPPAPFHLANKAIATFQGRAIVRVPFVASGGAAPAHRTVEGTVHYQACTEGSCLFPATRHITATIDLGGPATP